MMKKLKDFFEDKLNVFLFFTLLFLLIGISNTIFTKIEIIKNLWGLLSVLDTSSALAMAILAYIAYKEYIKNEDEIELKVAIYDNAKNDNPEIKDFYEIAGDKVKVLRKEVNRSEIMGILGMFQRDMKTRFEMKDNKLKILFLDNLKQIQKGEGNILIIPVLKEDYENFLNPKVIENEEKTNNDNN